jgi:anti-sigma factor (TIGR02949 family)
VKCKEFQDLITAAVDSYLQKQELEKFEEHARLCPPCRSEYELEKSTKRLLQNRARIVSVPPQLQNSILHQLERESGRSPAISARWTQLIRVPFVRAVLAMALTAVVIVLVTRPGDPSRQIPFLTTAGFGPNNVVQQSVENFHKVLRGEITPQFSSSERSEIQSFFSGKTGFPVVIPVMHECTLLGGVLNDHKGIPLAHVVYQMGPDIIYLYQACWETVQKGEALELAPEANSELIKTGWYFSGAPDGDAVVLWKSGRTLCIAVSHMQREKLLECLHSASTDSAAGW